MSAPSSDKKTQKFSALSPEQKRKIIDDFSARYPQEFLRLSVAIADLSTREEYAEMFSAAKSGAFGPEFIDENSAKIANFLRDCRLIGAVDEDEVPGSGNM